MIALRQAVNAYIEMRRGLGFKLQNAGYDLADFVDYMEQQDAPYITTKLALAWAQQPSQTKPSYWARRLGHVRVFARYHAVFDPRTQIPPDGLLPFRPQRARPYLYSKTEVEHLLAAALSMTTRICQARLKPWTYYCLLGLLSVSGMRVGEARNLKLADVDIDNAVLTIRDTKFGKSRLVPIHASTCSVLQNYIERRQRCCAAQAASPYLFTSMLGNRLDSGDISRTFCALSRQTGLRGPTDRYGPRLHDMRHTMATNTLVRWYEAGLDPERRLPVLSTYLGHASVVDTQWYLSASPELMKQAMHRLEQCWEDRP